MNENPQVRKQTSNSIDLAKFICSILVVMIHIAPFGNTEIPNLKSYLNFYIQNCLARIAVPFFFVTSGYYLYRKSSRSNFDLGPTKQYVKKIFRLYLIWTLIYFPLVFNDFFKNQKGIFYAVITYIRNFIFTGSYTQLWYLNALIFAVILVSFLLYNKVAPQKIIICSAIMYIIGLFAQSWFGFIRPLNNIFPFFWKMLKVFERVIVTTRNGLFEGFLFITIGMYFALFEIRIEKKRALKGLITCMVLLFLEVSILQFCHFIRKHDMYLFLVPATLFGFCFVREIKLPDKPIFRTLRILSSLIFYLHLWIGALVGRLLRSISGTLEESFLKFILTLLMTVLCSYIVFICSNRPGFKWLKKLYA